jgi:hypothetical protein
MTDPDSRVNRSYFRRRWEANQLPASGVWATRRRLADAMRTVIERLTISDAPEEELRVAAARLEEYAAHLERHPRRQKYVGFAETAVADAGGAEADAATGGHFDLSPLIGLSNPLSPPITMSSDEATGRVRGEVVFGSAYEGPPGCVHGGYVAAAFDEVLGYSETFSERTERRKVFCHGTLHAGEELCAEADGIFISMKPGVYARLVAQREKQEGA